MLDLGDLAAAMQRTYGYDYRSRRVPRVAYAAGAVRTVGVPNLLLARPGLRDDLAGTVVETMARDAAELVPGFALGVQYLTPATMIRTATYRCTRAPSPPTAGCTADDALPIISPLPSGRCAQ